MSKEQNAVRGRLDKYKILYNHDKIVLEYIDIEFKFLIIGYFLIAKLNSYFNWVENSINLFFCRPPTHPESLWNSSLRCLLVTIWSQGVVLIHQTFVACLITINKLLQVIWFLQVWVHYCYWGVTFLSPPPPTSNQPLHHFLLKHQLQLKLKLKLLA